MITHHRVHRDHAVRQLATATGLGPSGGELTVVDGSVWLTRRDDLGDHFVRAGQRVRLSRHAAAVIEPTCAGQRVTVRWQPHRHEGLRSLAAPILRRLAMWTRQTARWLDDAARQATAAACPAPGELTLADAWRAGRP